MRGTADSPYLCLCAFICGYSSSLCPLCLCGSFIMSIRFEVLHTDGAARLGRLHTPHGTVETPLFMPVGPPAPVQGPPPQQLQEAGARVVLGNTYHLALRPGDGLIAELGGLHRFMGWPGPILTDSGGFQV